MAAATVRMPVTRKVSSRPPAEPVCRVISAATMKTPEPIIDPTTNMVPSNNPSARTNSWGFGPLDIWRVAVSSIVNVRPKSHHQPVHERIARLELIDADRLVGLVGIGHRTGTADDHRNPAVLVE